MVIKKQVKKSKKSKKTAKKAGKKSKSSSVEVTIRKNILGEAPEEYHFVMKDGDKIKSIQELADKLEHMSEDVFTHHVNEAKNDFANWIGDVFNEEKLAKELRRTQNKIETRIKVLQRLVDEVIKEGERVSKKK